MGIFTYHPGRSKIYRYNTRESRPPWTGLCNKATHATAIGVETEFYNVFINIRPPSGSILLDDKYGLGGSSFRWNDKGYWEGRGGSSLR